MVETIALLLAQLFKRWIDARLHRTLAQYLGAKGMDRADGRFFEILQGFFQLGRARRLPSFIELLAKAKFQVASGFVRKRNGGNTFYGRAPRLEHCHDPMHQLGSLAGAGRGFDDQALIERFPNAPASLVVRDRACSRRVHAIPRISIRGSSRSSRRSFFVSRRSSYGPQTMR